MAIPATDPVASLTFPGDTTVMVWQLAADGACTYCSPAWLRFSGRSLEQELGKSWFEGVHELDRGVCESEFRQAVRARRAFSIRFRIRRSDGVYRTVVATGVPRHGAQGNLEGFEGTAVDITEQVTADGN